MKKRLSQILSNVCLMFLIFNTPCYAQNFTWKKGTSSTDVPGFYGTLGVSATGNRPGSRDHAATWTDAAGNFWLFGGNGYNIAGAFGYLSDLWKYDPTTNLWTWVNGSTAVNQVGLYGAFGVFSNTTVPGARYGSATFNDSNGNLYLFGGYGYDNAGSFGELNDMWVYSIALNQWKWIKGANTCYQTATYGTMGTSNIGNAPGARYYATSWKDGTGNFWVFGGIGYNSSSNAYLNDLWRYNPAINEWTWMNGSNFLNVSGIYGTQGTAAAANAPGARCSAGGWTDASGSLWLLGGYGYASSGPNSHLSDFWKYNVTTNQWTWIKGYSTSTIQQGIYGTVGVFASANLPGARYDAVTWVDATGDFWLFGGNGFDTGNINDYLNDLWRYNITSNQWMWVKGSNAIGQAGNYGTIGVNSAFNMPGCRGATAKWKDSSNNLWLFGGFGRNIPNNLGRLNDLWKFDNCVFPSISISASNSTLCLGNTATLTVSGAYTYTWAGSQTGSTLAVTPPLGSSTYTAYGADANECRDTTAFTMTVIGLPSVAALSNHSVICAFEFVNLSATGAVTYTWSTSQVTPSISVSPLVTTGYTVTGTDSNGCTNSVTIVQSVSNCTGIDNALQLLTEQISIYPNPANGAFTINAETSDKKNFMLFNAQGSKVFEQSIEAMNTLIKIELPKGIYYYQVFNSLNQSSKGKLIIN